MGTDMKNAIRISTWKDGDKTAVDDEQQIAVTLSPDGTIRIDHWYADAWKYDQIAVDLATLKALIAAVEGAK